MPIYRDREKGCFRFQYNRVIQGRRLRASRLLPKGWSRAQAEKYDRQEVARLHALALGVEQAEPLIAEAVALYLEHRIPALRNGKKAARDLSYLVPYIEGRLLSDLPEIAREYARDNPELAPATIRNRLAYLRAAARYAYREHGLGELDHTARMRLPGVQNERQVYLRPAELEQLAAACKDPDMRAVIRIAFYTGCRWISEILPRKPEDIIRNRSGWWLQVPQPKTGRPKMVPVHPTIREDLERLPFPARHWRDYYADFEAARRAVKRPGLRMHDLRHSLGAALISQGASLRLVGEALGHRSAQSTERYAHLYPEAVAQAVKKVPTAMRKKKAA